MPSLPQRSFAGGEISPALYGRMDVAKYQTGCRTLRNFIVQRYGGVTNRPGTQLITPCNGVTRLLRFVFNNAQSFVVVLEANTITFIQAGINVPCPASPPAWNNATVYQPGDVVSYTHLFITTTWYCIAGNVNQTPAAGIYWFQEVRPLIQLVVPTPYAAGDLFSIKYAECADVVILTHPSYPPYILKRYGTSSWSFTQLQLVPSIAAPTGLVVTAGRSPGAGAAAPASVSAAGGTGVGTTVYQVSSWNNAFGSESPYATHTIVSSPTGGSPITVTWPAAFGSPDGYALYRNNLLIYVGPALTFSDTGQTGAKPIRQAPAVGATPYYWIYVVTAVSAADSTESLASAQGSCNGINPSGTSPNIITWTAVAGASAYNIYRQDVNGTFGYIGTSQTTTFLDGTFDAGGNPVAFTPNIADTPPIAFTDLNGANNYPSAVSFYQQRLSFGGTNSKPTKIWMSRIGSFYDFSTSTPIGDSDSVSFEIASARVNLVEHLIDLGTCIVLTSGGQYVVEGDANGTVTPTAINLRAQGTHGSNGLQPILIGNDVLYVQSLGTTVRDLKFNWQTQGYVGEEISIFAQHLFDGYSLVDWDYSEVPNSVVWAVRSDGLLLGMTYVKEQEVWGWHHHDTRTLAGQSTFESVISVPEGSENVVYVVVNRVVAGAAQRTIERFYSRFVTNVAIDAHFVDCSVWLDGRNVGYVGATNGMTLTTVSGGWTYLDTLTLTCAAATVFPHALVGDAILLKQYDAMGNLTDSVQLVITAIISSSVVTVKASKTVPAWAHAGAIATYDFQYGSVAVTPWNFATGGLMPSIATSLTGETVTGLADGSVIPAATLSGVNPFVLPAPATCVTLGLPFTSDFETLDVENLQGETLTDKRGIMKRAVLQVRDSRGFYITGADTAQLYQWTQRQYENMGDPIATYTGPVEQLIEGTWDFAKRIFVRQSDPLPLTILSITGSGEIGEA